MMLGNNKAAGSTSTAFFVPPPMQTNYHPTTTTMQQRRSTSSSPPPPLPQNMMATFNTKASSSTPKRYKCTVCFKKFTRPSSLTTHMYSHTGEVKLWKKRTSRERDTNDSPPLSLETFQMSCRRLRASLFGCKQLETSCKDSQ